MGIVNSLQVAFEPATDVGHQDSWKTPEALDHGAELVFDAIAGVVGLSLHCAARNESEGTEFGQAMAPDARFHEDRKALWRSGLGLSADVA